MKFLYYKRKTLRHHIKEAALYKNLSAKMTYEMVLLTIPITVNVNKKIRLSKGKAIHILSNFNRKYLHSHSFKIHGAIHNYGRHNDAFNQSTQ